MVVCVSQNDDEYDNEHLANVCPHVHIFFAFEEYDSVDSLDLEYGKKRPEDEDCQTAHLGVGLPQRLPKVRKQGEDEPRKIHYDYDIEDMNCFDERCPLNLLIAQYSVILLIFSFLCLTLIICFLDLIVHR